MNSNLVAGLAFVLALGAGWVALSNSGAAGPQGPQGTQGPRGEQGIAGRNGLDGSDGMNGSNGRNGVDGSQTFGAVANTDIDQPCYSYGGVRFCTVKQAMAATSSSVCNIKPKWTGSGNATSTLMAFTAHFTSIGTLGTQTYDLSTTTATGGNGSSTPAFIKAASVANAKRTVAWLPGATTTAVNGVVPSSLGNGESLAVVAPGESLSFRIATATPGTFATYVTGTCEALFMAAN